MAYSETSWRAYVEASGIEVPEERVQGELEYLKLDLRHRMQYDTLATGAHHLFPERELAAQADELRALALFEAKQELVLENLLATHDFTVTRAELEAEAAAVAARQGATPDMVRLFFGEDLSGLERDIRERKAKEWACAAAGA